MNRVRNELLAKVPAMPEEWDGQELRWLIADARVLGYNKERLTRNL
jgi:hypothetical protein